MGPIGDFLDYIILYYIILYYIISYHIILYFIILCYIILYYIILYYITLYYSIISYDIISLYHIILQYIIFHSYRIPWNLEHQYLWDLRIYGLKKEATTSAVNDDPSPSPWPFPGSSLSLCRSNLPKLEQDTEDHVKQCLKRCRRRHHRHHQTVHNVSSLFRFFEVSQMKVLRLIGCFENRVHRRLGEYIW